VLSVSNADFVLEIKTDKFGQITISSELGVHFYKGG
jgi:hypothetical protein